MKVIHKVWIVTGAGNGIGREVALQILHKGGKVAALDINLKGLEETQNLANHFKPHISIHQVDLSQKEQVESVKNEILKIHQTIDGIINVAGIIQPFVPILELDYEKIHQVMDVNFYGTLHMIKTFLPLLLSKDEAHITNVSSMGAYVPVPGQSIYGASKAAVELLTLALHSELKKTNVSVTLVLPGGVATNIAENSNASFKPEIDVSKTNYTMLTPQKAAELIIKATEKKKYRVPIGKDAKFMNFLAKKVSLKKAANIIADKLG